MLVLGSGRIWEEKKHVETTVIERSKSCSHTTDCELYARLSMDSLLDFWRGMYCDAGYERCARYKLAERGETVSPTLLPNGKDLANPGGS